jgi:ATP-dependent DNA helicase RecG
VTLLGGAPNAHVARFVATLPAEHADAPDTMLVLLILLKERTTTAAEMAPILQRSEIETAGVLEQLAAEPVAMIERTRATVRNVNGVYRLREHAVTALGPAIAYRRRTQDESDRKIIGMLRETSEVNGRMVRILLDVDVVTASRLLADLVERQILVKTSKAQRGPGVTYGAGPAFPKKRAPRRGAQDA